MNASARGYMIITGLSFVLFLQSIMTKPPLVALPSLAEVEQDNVKFDWVFVSYDGGGLFGQCSTLYSVFSRPATFMR